MLQTPFPNRMVCFLCDSKTLFLHPMSISVCENRTPFPFHIETFVWVYQTPFPTRFASFLCGHVYSVVFSKEYIYEDVDDMRMREYSVVICSGQLWLSGGTWKKTFPTRMVCCMFPHKTPFLHSMAIFVCGHRLSFQRHFATFCVRSAKTVSEPYWPFCVCTQNTVSVPCYHFLCGCTKHRFRTVWTVLCTHADHCFCTI